MKKHWQCRIGLHRWFKNDMSGIKVRICSLCDKEQMKTRSRTIFGIMIWYDASDPKLTKILDRFNGQLKERLKAAKIRND